jgi:glycerol-3-phosphate acyltransferase PlsY
MLELGVKLLLAYLIGTVMGSMILGSLRGVDIREMGSGNAGATNALRTQGKLFGLTVLVIDILKGVIAVRWLPGAALPMVEADPELSRAWLAVACGLAVIIGHVFPVWYEFRGGKGVATVLGVVGALEPRMLMPLVGSWLVVVVFTGYVGLASMLAGLALIVAVLLLEPGNLPMLSFALAVSAFIIYTHRANIARMRAGQENRARKLWLFRPRAA